MSENDGHSIGLLSSIRTALDSTLGLVQSRIELFGVELQEEKLRIFQLFLGTAVLVALGTVSLALVTITIIVAFWEAARVAALCGLSAFYLSATFLIYRKLADGLKNGHRALSATAEEIRKDRQCLSSRN